ncbi:MAG: DUF6064 family protein [Candidatus Marinimicrobia bacterium]|nr:DUF6064 family protein [Candidatus Neomarinimicrobiota bacterium]
MPFNVEQFLEVIKNYNLAIGILPVVIAFSLGILAIWELVKKKKHADKLINNILAVFWIWNGAVYHLGFFLKINPAARIFGILFIIQGLLFLYYGNFTSKLQYTFRKGVYYTIAWVLIVYAILIYNILSPFLGHVYPVAPLFGIAPCPTTIFTLGILIFTNEKMPKVILIVPFIWSLIGGSASILFGIYEDILLLISGVLTIALIYFRNKSKNLK